MFSETVAKRSARGGSGILQTVNGRIVVFRRSLPRVVRMGDRIVLDGTAYTVQADAAGELFIIIKAGNREAVTPLRLLLGEKVGV